MDNTKRYRKELDLIFQSMDEKEKLAEQARVLPRAEFIIDLLSRKPIQKLMQPLSADERKQVIEACLQARFPDSD